MRPLDSTFSSLLHATLCACLATAAAPVLARQGEPPYSLLHPSKLAVTVPIEEVGAIDAAQRRIDADASTRSLASPTKRLPVADGIRVAISADRNGRWQLLPDGSRLWRVRVRAAGATDLRLGFAQVALPPAATLHMIGAGDYYQGPYTAADAESGSFHSSVVPGDMVTIELHIPAGTTLRPDALELTSVGAGFRDVFGRAKAVTDTGPGTSGACNVNVVCPLGQPYPAEIRAVAYYEFQDDDDAQFYVCSGTLLNDVPQDRKPYLLTAAHCISSAAEASSMVVYWNYQSTQCSVSSPPAGGYFNDDQHGTVLRATRDDADFTLVQLTQAPDASWQVYYAGWDASGTTPAATVGIHHPSGDVKKITAGPRPTTTDNCIGSGGASRNTHWETGPYAQGTTEGGSSGSGLFTVAGNGGGHDQLLIGTLSGRLRGVQPRRSRPAEWRHGLLRKICGRVERRERIVAFARLAGSGEYRRGSAAGSRQSGDAAFAAWPLEASQAGGDSSAARLARIVPAAVEL